MINFVALGLLLGGGYLAYKKFGGSPKLQSLRSLIPGTKTPVQIVVPYGSAPTLSKTNVPIPPGNGPQAVYTPPRPSTTSTVNPSIPTIITPTGASNLSVQSDQDVQRALNTLGFATPPLKVDGNLGPLSKSAIVAFQSAHNLSPDGIAGPQTKAALQDALMSSAATNSPIGAAVQAATAAAVAGLAAVNPALTSANVGPQQIQHLLNLLGASPILVEDGNIGPASTAAIKAFQIAHGLVADGVAGPKTISAMLLASNPSS